MSESVSLRRRLVDALGLAMATIWLGLVVSLRGDPTKAAVLQAEGLTISRARGVVWGLIGGFLGMSLVLHARADPEKAAQLVGCAEALLDSTGIVIKAGDQAIVDNLRRALRVQLGDSAFESARRAGRAMARSEAIELALAVCPPEASSPIAGWRKDSGQQVRLTAREREIAVMLVRGDTNSQIAAALSLSRRTVDTHVGRILQKRGVSSRTQLAAPL